MQLNGDGLEIITSFRLPARSVEEFIPEIEQLIKVQVSENQFGALVSFAHSVGIGNFRRSRLLRYLNQGYALNAADEFLSWTLKNGKTNETQKRRRKMERKLFLRLAVVCNNPDPGG